MLGEGDLWGQNPWWYGPQRISEDEQIIEWERSGIRCIPDLKGEIAYDFEPSNTVVYSLRGLRQVGKTTLIKLQIREFLEKGVQPLNVLYYSLDMSNTKDDVADVVTHWRRIGRRHQSGHRCYAFLDEISSVSDWQKAVKWLVDTGALKNCTVLVTGSHTIDIKRSAERLPGRRGVVDGSHDKAIYPMSFLKYVKITREDTWEAIIRSGLHDKGIRRSVFSKLARMEIDDALDRVSMERNNLDAAMQEYMITGGIPKVVDEKIRKAHITEGTYKSYMDAITWEWDALSKNRMLLAQFFRTVIKSQGTHLSWSALRREADLGSTNTAMDYADTLERMFLMSVIYRYDEEKAAPMIRKDRKFYIRDPFLLHVIGGRTGSGGFFETSTGRLQDEATRGKMVEGLVAEHLIRLAASRSRDTDLFDYRDHVFYWKDDGGGSREVDFVLRGVGGADVPIESKYRNSVGGRDLGGMYRFMDRTGARGGIVVTRSDLGAKDGRVEVPAGVFLLLA